MKAIRHRFPLPLPLRRLPLRSPFVHHQIPAMDSPFSSSATASSSAATETTTTLSQDELIKINLLLPRLCLHNHHSTAITLLDTALLANPPLQSLPLSILTHSLASQSDYELTLSLLTCLKDHRNARLYSGPIVAMLIRSYCKCRKFEEALKTFRWMGRPWLPCEPDEKVYGTLIAALCRNGMALAALEVLKSMIGSNLVPERNLRNSVFRALLRVAMIAEAMELNETLDCVDDRNMGDRLRKASELLDRIINNWIEDNELVSTLMQARVPPRGKGRH